MHHSPPAACCAHRAVGLDQDGTPRALTPQRARAAACCPQRPTAGTNIYSTGSNSRFTMADLIWTFVAAQRLP